MRHQLQSYIHNWVTSVIKSHSSLWHICCCIACIPRLLYITNDKWYMLHAYEVTFFTIHFVTYISKVHYHKKYSSFLHIYCLVSCCLTSATVIYITMLWMKIASCWCMLWMKSLRFCGVIYIKIYWHLFDIIIYYGNKAVYISWIDPKKLANNSCKPVQDCCEKKNNINLQKKRLTLHFVIYIYI